MKKSWFLSVLMVCATLVGGGAFAGTCGESKLLLKGLQNPRDDEFLYSSMNAYNSVKDKTENNVEHSVAGTVYECDDGACEGNKVMYLSEVVWKGESHQGNLWACNTRVTDRWMMMKEDGACYGFSVTVDGFHELDVRLPDGRTCYSHGHGVTEDNICCPSSDYLPCMKDNKCKWEGDPINGSLHCDDRDMDWDRYAKKCVKSGGAEPEKPSEIQCPAGYSSAIMSTANCTDGTKLDCANGMWDTTKAAPLCKCGRCIPEEQERENPMPIECKAPYSSTVKNQSQCKTGETIKCQENKKDGSGNCICGLCQSEATPTPEPSPEPAPVPICPQGFDQNKLASTCANDEVLECANNEQPVNGKCTCGKCVKKSGGDDGERWSCVKQHLSNNSVVQIALDCINAQVIQQLNALQELCVSTKGNVSAMQSVLNQLAVLVQNNCMEGSFGRPTSCADGFDATIINAGYCKSGQEFVCQDGKGDRTLCACGKCVTPALGENWTCNSLANYNSIIAYATGDCMNAELQARLKKILTMCTNAQGNRVQIEAEWGALTLEYVEKECKSSESSAVISVKKKAEDNAKIIDSIKASFDVTVWKDAEGKFNTSRLISDSVAGVVLGTTGGLVTSSVVKKKQVENGFEDIKCTVGGQVVADWGDDFNVGIQ